MPIKCWFVLMPIGYIYFSAVLYFNDMARVSFHFILSRFFLCCVCVFLGVEPCVVAGFSFFISTHHLNYIFGIYRLLHSVRLFWFGVAFKALSSCYFYVILFLNAHCYRTTITKLITYKSLFVVFNGLLLFGHIVLERKKQSPPSGHCHHRFQVELAPPLPFVRILLTQHSTAQHSPAPTTTEMRLSILLHLRAIPPVFTQSDGDWI